MAGMLLVVLLGLAVVVLEDGRASGTLDVHGLGLGVGLSGPDGVDGEGLDDFNVGFAQLGGEEEGVGSGCQAGCSDKWSQQHDGCGDESNSLMMCQDKRTDGWNMMVVIWKNIASVSQKGRWKMMKRERNKKLRRAGRLVEYEMMKGMC